MTPVRIFISSTVTNLIDLREELKNFIDEMGYQAEMSSAVGFPDSRGAVDVWEGCLDVISDCLITLLVIDGKYGEPVEWIRYRGTVDGRKVSPTHAEYLRSREMEKRLMVFVREKVMVRYYDLESLIRNDDDKENKDLQRFKGKLFLPDDIQFETLEFIHEIKTKRPVLFINEFKTVVDLKLQLKKKMVNELATLFLLNFDILLNLFTKAIAQLPEEKQTEVFKTFNTVQAEIDKVHQMHARKIEELELKLKSAESKSERSKIEDEVKKSKDELSQYDQTVEKLTGSRVKTLRDRIMELAGSGGSGAHIINAMRSPLQRELDRFTSIAIGHPDYHSKAYDAIAGMQSLDDALLKGMTLGNSVAGLKDSSVAEALHKLAGGMGAAESLDKLSGTGAADAIKN